MPYTGVLRAILKGRLAGTVATRNMFTGQIQLAGTDTDMDVLYAYLQEIFDDLDPFLSTVWTAESVDIQHYVDGEWFTMSTHLADFAGTASGDYLPNLVAGVLIGKVPGWRALGRKFISGIAESSTTANALTATALAAFTLACVHYVAPFYTTEGSLFGPGVVDKNGSFHAFSSGLVSSLLGSMRRRKPGLGI